MTTRLTSLRVEVAADSTSYVAAMDAKAAADARAIASGNALAAGLEQTDRRLAVSGSAAERLARSLDPAYAAQQKLENGARSLQRALDNGAISTDRHGQLLDLLTKRYAPIIQGGAAAAGTIGILATAARGTGQDLERLAGSHDRVVGSTLAAREGIRLTHELLTGEYSRAIGTSIVSLEYLGVAHKIVALAMKPFVIVATAVAGALFLLIHHAGENASQLREFNLILEGTGRGSLTTAGNLQAAVRELRAMGVAAKDADEAVKSIARTPTLNPAQAATIARTGVNVGARLGLTDAQGIAEYTKAISGGLEPTLKLGFALNALSVAEATNILEMDRHGQHAAALDRAIADIVQNTSGAHEKSLSDAAKAIDSISTAWSNMLDKLSETRAIQGARDAIIGMLNAVSGAAAAAAGRDIHGTVGLHVPVPASAPQSADIGWYDAARRWHSGARPLVAGDAFQSAGGAVTAAAIAPFVTATLDAVRTGQVSPATIGGAVRTTAIDAAAAPGANVSGLNNEFSGRLDAWLASLSDADRALVHITSAYRDAATQATLFSGSDQSGRMVAAAGGSAHNYGIAADVQGMSQGARDSLSRYGLHTPMPWEPWHVEPVETLNADQATAAQRRASFGQFVAARYDFSNVGTTAAAPGDTSQRSPDDEKATKAAEAYGKLKDKIADTLAVEQRRGSEAQALAAYQQTYNEAVGRGVEWWAAMGQAETAAQGVRDKTGAQLKKGIEDEDLRARMAVATAKAYGVDEVRGIQAAAAAQAALAQQQEPAINLAQKTQEILRAGATNAILAASQAEAAMVPQIAAEQRLAEAAAKSAGALHDQTIQNEAIARTQDAYNNALATGDAALIAIAKAEQDRAVGQARALDTLKQRTALEAANSNDRNSAQIAQLEVGLQGQTTDQISKAVDLLKARQQLDAAGVKDTDAIYQKRLADVAALADMNATLHDTQREQQRIDDGFRSIAGTVDNTLTKSITDAFDGKKVTDWGTQLKTMLGSIVSQIANSAFIKPLIGTVLGGLGLNSVAQQFGSFGNLFGGSSGVAAGSMPMVVATPNGSGGFSLSTAGNVLSLGNSVSGGGGLFGSSSSGGLFGGIGNSINNFGGALGFATPADLATASQVAAMWGGGGESSVLSGLTSGNLFGSTTLTGALGAPGGGYAAGNLVEALA